MSSPDLIMDDWLNNNKDPQLWRKIVIPADQILKERLAYFLKQFEENFKEQIELFKDTGNTSYFENSKIIRMAKEILDV